MAFKTADEIQKSTNLFSETDYAEPKVTRPAGSYHTLFTECEDMDFKTDENPDAEDKLWWKFEILAGPLTGQFIIISSGKRYVGKRATLPKILNSFLGKEYITKEEFITFDPGAYGGKECDLIVDVDSFLGKDFNRLVTLSWRIEDGN